MFATRISSPHYTLKGRKYLLSPVSAMGRVSADHVYLWALDDEKQIVGMWDTRSGSEKLLGPLATVRRYLDDVRAREEINSTTSQSFKALRSHFRQLESEVTEQMVGEARFNQSDGDTAAETLVRETFARLVQPFIERGIANAKMGQLPSGFVLDFESPRTEGQQVAAHLVNDFMNRLMPLERVERNVENAGIVCSPETVAWTLQEIRREVTTHYKGIALR